jgi:hypothetical protein
MASRRKQYREIPTDLNQSAPATPREARPLLAHGHDGGSERTRVALGHRPVSARLSAVCFKR